MYIHTYLVIKNKQAQTFQHKTRKYKIYALKLCNMLKQSLCDIVLKFKVNMLIRTGITAFLQNLLNVSTSPLAACFQPSDEVVNDS